MDKKGSGDTNKQGSDSTETDTYLILGLWASEVRKWLLGQGIEWEAGR